MVFNFTILSGAGIFMCCVYLCAGIVDAICGGGGLFTVPALMSIGMAPHMVVGTNQCSLILGNLMSIYKYAKSGNINYRIACMALPFTLVGAVIGAKLNLIMSERALQIVMIVLLPILAVFSFIKRDIGNEDHSAELQARTLFIGAAVIGLVVSAYHSFYGPASGLFFLMLFCAVTKLDVLKSNGVTKIILFVACLTSGITYALSGNVCWPAVIADSVTYIIGNYIGSTLAIHKGAKIVKPAFYVMLVFLFIKLILDYFVK